MSIRVEIFNMNSTGLDFFCAERGGYNFIVILQPNFHNYPHLPPTSINQPLSYGVWASKHGGGSNIFRSTWLITILFTPGGGGGDFFSHISQCVNNSPL